VEIHEDWIGQHYRLNMERLREHKKLKPAQGRKQSGIRLE